jgi:hypothetical protein
MLITNKCGLPNAIVRAVQNDDYDDGGADITVSALVSPPRVVTLRKQYADQLVEDAADRIYSLQGQAIHTVLERAGGNELKEQRVFTEVNGWKVSGKFDNVCLERGVLCDYKHTSVWSVVFALKDGKAEWESSTNLYAHLCQLNGISGIRHLRIVAILRDWSKRKAQTDPEYPQQQVAVIPIPLWPREQTVAYLEERVRLHQAARTTLPVCTDEEVWRKPTTWAVMKPGQKKAVRVLPSLVEAQTYAGRGHMVVERPGEATRCSAYCSVAPYCDQWKEEQHVNDV